MNYESKDVDECGKKIMATYIKMLKNNSGSGELAEHIREIIPMAGWMCVNNPIKSTIALDSKHTVAIQFTFEALDSVLMVSVVAGTSIFQEPEIYDYVVRKELYQSFSIDEETSSLVLVELYSV